LKTNELAPSFELGEEGAIRLVEIIALHRRAVGAGLAHVTSLMSCIFGVKQRLHDFSGLTAGGI
jgi:hypothetical protein